MNPKKVSQFPINKIKKYKKSSTTVSNIDNKSEWFLKDHALKNGEIMLKIQLWITEINDILLK